MQVVVTLLRCRRQPLAGASYPLFSRLALVAFPGNAGAAVSSCCGVEIPISISALFERLKKGGWALSGLSVRLLGMERCRGYPRATPSITICTGGVCANAETSEHFWVFYWLFHHIFRY